MKYLIAICFLFLTVQVFPQLNGEDHVPDLAWKTIPDSIQYLGVDTFLLRAVPFDFNDPGAIGREVGGYLMDNVGNVYTIISSTSTTITVYDEFGLNLAPEVNQVGWVYNSVGNNRAPYIAPVLYEQLDSKARSNADRIFKSVLWEHGLGIPFDSLTVDTSYTVTGTETKGTTFWDEENLTISTVLGNGVVYQWAKEAFMDGQNDTGSEIENGTPVMYQGSIGNSGNFRMTRAIASKDYPTYLFVGLVTEPIQDGEVGKITTRGKLRGVQTNGANYGETWNDGDIIYLSGSTAGYLTNIEPEAPIPAITVALVISAHLTNGTLEIRPTFPAKVSELSDVDGTPLSETGQIMVWNNDSKYFDFDYNINGLFKAHGTILKDSASLSYVDATRTVSVTPTNENWYYYFEGQKFAEQLETASHANATGMYHLYFDETNTLQFNLDDWDLLTDVPIAEVYYDATKSEGVVFEERHSAYRNRIAHIEFHRKIGTYKVSGFGISGYTLQPASPTNANNTFALTSGIIADEDLESTLAALPDDGPYKVWYRTGASGAWTWAQYNAPLASAGSYIQFNEYTGATWQLSAAANNDFVNMWVCKVPAVENEYQTVLIMDQDVHTNEDEAYNQLLGELNLGDFPLEELVAIYKITFSTNASYTTLGKCRINAVVEELANLITLTASQSINNHEALNGLLGGDATNGHWHLTEGELLNLQDTIPDSLYQHNQRLINIENDTTIWNNTADSIPELRADINQNTGKDTTGIYHANRSDLDLVSGTNTGDQTLSGLGGVSGSGTTNYVTKFTGSSSIGNSQIFDNGTNIGIGTASPSTSLLHLNYNSVNHRALRFQDENGIYDFITSGGSISHSFGLYDDTNGAYRLFIDNAGNVGIGTTSPNNKLDVNGTTETDAIKITTGATDGYFLKSDASGNASWAEVVAGSTDTIYGGNARIGEITIDSYTETITFVEPFADDNYFLIINPTYDYIVGTDTIPIEIGIKNFSQNANGFTVDLKVNTGTLKYFAADSVNTPLILDDYKLFADTVDSDGYVTNRLLNDTLTEYFKYSETQSLSYSATIGHDANNGRNAVVTLTGDATYSLSHVRDDDQGDILVIQGGSGGYGLTSVTQTGLTTVYPDIDEDGTGERPTGTNINSAVGNYTVMSYHRIGSYLLLTYGSFGE